MGGRNCKDVDDFVRDIKNPVKIKFKKRRDLRDHEFLSLELQKKDATTLDNILSDLSAFHRHWTGIMRDVAVHAARRVAGQGRKAKRALYALWQGYTLFGGF
ncbi:hypothetical protein VTJ49DRAFT_6242 [Mycothermus thermophilus]|uniref:Uncharacterized protein n=1 Tax=Humicola insolens TaxID=85995 RepID=A0ABR3VJL9_HUMIN